MAIDDGSSINNGSVTPMIHACLSRQPNSYEAVVTLARKAKQRTLLDQVAGQQNTEGIKPLLQQMREETRLWDEDPQRDEPGEAFSWPPKIGVTWTDDGKADLEVMGSQTRAAGRDSCRLPSFQVSVPALLFRGDGDGVLGVREPPPRHRRGSRLRRAPALARRAPRHGAFRRNSWPCRLLRLLGGLSRVCGRVQNFRAAVGAWSRRRVIVWLQTHRANSVST